MNIRRLASELANDFGSDWMNPIPIDAEIRIWRDMSEAKDMIGAFPAYYLTGFKYAVRASVYAGLAAAVSRYLV